MAQHDNKTAPPLTPVQRAAAAREARLARALRDNLRRRKAQTRAREADAPNDGARGEAALPEDAAAPGNAAAEAWEGTAPAGAPQAGTASSDEQG